MGGNLDCQTSPRAAAPEAGVVPVEPDIAEARTPIATRVPATGESLGREPRPGFRIEVAVCELMVKALSDSIPLEYSRGRKIFRDL